MNKEFDFEMDCKPDFGVVTVNLEGDQTIKVEASAMAAMDTNVEMKTKFKGGFKRFFTGESLFINEFTARLGRGEIVIAPGSPGDIEHLHLDGDTIYLQNSAYVASGLGVDINMKWQGFMKGFFSNEGLFLIQCTGHGDLFFNTFGAMVCIDVDGEYVVDNGHIVAFTEGLEYNISKVGGYKSLFFSGEGLICRFHGQGKVWIQTRQLAAFASWVYPYRPAQNNG